MERLQSLLLCPFLVLALSSDHGHTGLGLALNPPPKKHQQTTHIKTFSPLPLSYE